MEFEWNAEKRRSNIAKRGVDFLDAVGIFIGNVLERIDDRSDYGEVRVNCDRYRRHVGSHGRLHIARRIPTHNFRTKGAYQ